MEEFNSITPETPLTPVMITDGEVVPPKQTSSSAGFSGRTTISKYLVCPANTTPSGIGHKSLPRARLLTSVESLAMLEEKEKKQRDEKEQKEKRKKEREEKKKQREADMKRKAEERAKKTEEWVKKAKVKAQKAAEKKREETRGEKKECQGTKLGSISLKEEQSQ